MNCTIISVGTEILFGQIVNTNTVYLSQELNMLGLNVLYHYTVGDNPKRLEETLKESMEKSDLIITTGGLGPTQDDLTKETIAKAFDTELIIHEESYEELKEFFNKLDRPMTDNNLKQAYLPTGSIALKNDFGTAPGFMLEKNDKIIISLPGPPKEMKPMFENYAKKQLEKKSNKIIHSKILRFFGIGESTLETELQDLITNQTDPSIAPYAKEGEVTLRVTSKRETIEEANIEIDRIVELIKEKVEKYIYSYENEELNEVVVKKLIKNNKSISLAESCTGGLLAARLTDVSGVSKVFNRGFITYSNEAKHELLNVDNEILAKHGAVSEETAIAMAKGLKAKTGSDVNHILFASKNCHSEEDCRRRSDEEYIW